VHSCSAQTTLELSKNEDFTRMLEAEEEHVKLLVQDVLRVRPDLVVTEKGVSDLAIHYLQRANVSCLRRLRKTDNLRLARVCGATIVSRVDELKEEDVGTRAALFEVRKLGDEYFAFVTGAEPKACTVLLRGASKDVLNEMERNLQDAMCAARNVFLDGRIVPGGGAIEMALAQSLMEKSKSMTGVMQWPYRAVASALESLPRTLLANCGANTIRVLTSLRAKHAAHLASTGGACTWGVNGESGELADMRSLGVWDPLVVKSQTYKTAIETAISLLRIDGIVRGLKKKGAAGGGAAGEGREREEEAPAANEGPAE
jgi:T-complex protein 1 subunit gamma